ncbi:MAG: Xaa-Pro peptidase family protein [Actinomycetes bacterium]
MTAGEPPASGSGPAARRVRVAEWLQRHAVDSALVTRLVDVRYLTGFTGSHGAVLVHADGSAVLATDGRYRDQVADEAPDLTALISRDVDLELARTCRAGSVLGFQADHVTVADFEALEEQSPARLARLGDLLRDLRQVKDDLELAALRTACAISDQALADLMPWVRVGQTERDVARRLESLMLEHGADAISFDTIVAAGENSAIPHHSPTHRPLAPGDLLKIDFGALSGGYHADITRTFVLSGPPSDWQQEIYLAVAAAQRAGRTALAPGVTGVEVDREARAVLIEAGLAENYTHGLGHGVGLEIHEAPFLGPTSADTLQAGVPVTVEPGVYLPGRGGVRIEDTLVVRHGKPESLTTTTRELLVLG